MASLVGAFAASHGPLIVREWQRVPAEQQSRMSAAYRELGRRLIAAKPDVLWVGIGVPKQEKWMARMRDRLDVPVMCAVGAAFDFHAGRISQAPEWMQQRGLEWTYRIAQEPRRLLPRYMNYNPRFMRAFGRQLVRERRHRAAAGDAR